MSYFVYPFFFNDRPIDVNWILNWNLNRYFYNFLNFDWRAINVDRLVDIDRLLDDCWHLYCSNYLFWNLFNHLNRGFLLNLYVFWHLDYLFNNSLWTHHMLWNLYDNLDRFFNDNFFDNLFWSSTINSRDLIIFFFEEFL